MSRQSTVLALWQATKYTDFWIRGQAASIATVVYCMQNMEPKVAAQAMLGLSAGIAVLYLFNAKFGYLSLLDVKCALDRCRESCASRHTDLNVRWCADPMHYLPEMLMLSLTVAGVLALKA